MATFDVIEKEGLRIVRATLKNETVRAESGALYYMRGQVELQTKAPGIGGFFKAMATGETVFRPTYTGTGEVYFEPSFGNFHIFDLAGGEWILERGAYWASDAGVEVDVYRDPTLTSLLSGQGFLNFQTLVRGQGQVVIQAQGDVETLNLNNERLVVDGTFVVARSKALKYRIEKASKSILGSMASGEGLVATFEGTGPVLIAPFPYWRARLANMIGAITLSRPSAS